jgi:D-3-phosphoglycerate dehydrogenase
VRPQPITVELQAQSRHLARDEEATLVRLGSDHAELCERSAVRRLAAERGILLTNTPEANAAAVADLTVALLLAALRPVTAGDRDVRTGAFAARRGRELGAMCLGLAGFGRIGRAVAARVRGFGCRLLVSDPLASDAVLRDHGARRTDLAGLSAHCDAVSLHVPGGRCLVDRAWIDAARPGLLLVNTARADVVDEGAVAAALRQGRLSAYATDTLAAETTGAPAPLLAGDLADRVVVTPHLGAQTIEAVDRMGLGAAEAVLDALAGRTPRHVVPPVEGE